MWIAFLLDACVILLVVIMIVFGMKKGLSLIHIWQATPTTPLSPGM